MKRCIATLLSLGMVGLAVAQAPFTIVRPADGSKVREKVHFLMPKGSIQEGNYVGVFCTYPDSSGKAVRRFVEAMVPEPPDKKSKYAEYVLDTKERGIPDGQITVELVLYIGLSDQPRIVDRSSVNLTVANSASIKVPPDGFKLRYKYRTGMEYTYNLEMRTSVSSLTEVQNKMGNRAAELPVEGQKVRLLYAFDNSYPNGDALMHIQAVPTKGKDYAYLLAGNATAVKKYWDYDMHPVYMRITGTGMQVFGSIPAYWPLEGTAGISDRLSLFACYPLPTLPDKPRKPGENWPARFQDSDLDMDKLNEVNSVVARMPARGEFLRVEWESGFPCAVIRHTLDVGTMSKEGSKLADTGATFTDTKTTIEETFWFALDRGIVVKMVRDYTRDRKFSSGGGILGGGNAGNSRGAGAPGAASPGAPGGGAPGSATPDMQRGGYGGRQGGYGGGGGRRGGGQGGPGGQGPGGVGGPGGNPGGPPTTMGGGAPRGSGSGAGAGSGGQIRYIRIREQEIFTLEQ